MKHAPRPSPTARRLLPWLATLGLAACASEVGGPELAASAEALHPAEPSASAWLLLGDELVQECSEEDVSEAWNRGFLLEPISEEASFVLLLDEDGEPLCVDETSRLLALLHQTALRRRGGSEAADHLTTDDPEPWPIHPFETMDDPEPWPIRPPTPEPAAGSERTAEGEMDLTEQGFEHDDTGSSMPEERQSGHPPSAPDTPRQPEAAPPPAGS